MRTRWLILAIALMLIGCSAAPLSDNPGATVLHWSDDTIDRRCAYLWKAEADKRFPGCVVVMCHGATQTVTDAKGIKHTCWMAVADSPRQWVRVDELARVLHNVYPGREVVLIVCNTGNFNLDTPHVWYAKSSIFTYPHSLDWIRSGAVGSINQFVSPATTSP